MAYIPLLQMRVKTKVQSVIARRRSCTDSKDPDAGSKRGSVLVSPAHTLSQVCDTVLPPTFGRPGRCVQLAVVVLSSVLRPSPKTSGYCR